jgi:hypothetical protein
MARNVVVPVSQDDPADDTDDPSRRRKAMQPDTSHLTLHFFRHYAEMVAAMFIGMFALSKPADWLFTALGTSTSGDHSAMMLFSMGITMTLPMVGWMRYRGHAWRATTEMAASMLIPTFAAMAVVASGAMDRGPVMIIEHIVMLAGMLIVMLFRRDEYSGVGHVHGTAQEATAA